MKTMQNERKVMEGQVQSDHAVLYQQLYLYLKQSKFIDV